MYSSVSVVSADMIENTDGVYVGIFENYVTTVIINGNDPWYVSEITVDGKTYDIEKDLISVEYANKAKGQKVIFELKSNVVVRLSIFSEIDKTKPWLSVSWLDPDEFSYSDGSFDNKSISINGDVFNFFAYQQNTWGYDILKENGLSILDDMTITLKSSDPDVLFFKDWSLVIPQEKGEITFDVNGKMQAGETKDFTRKIYVNKEYVFSEDQQTVEIEIYCTLTAKLDGVSVTSETSQKIRLVNNDYGKSNLDFSDELFRECDYYDFLNKLRGLVYSCDCIEPNEQLDLYWLMTRVITEKELNDLAKTEEVLEVLEDVYDLGVSIDKYSNKVYLQIGMIFFDALSSELDKGNDEIEEILDKDTQELLKNKLFKKLLKWYEEEYLVETGKSKKYSGKCPIDITVTDDDGVTVLSIINNAIELCDESVYAFVVNDKKTFYLPTDVDHTITITATGDGTMDYSIQEYSPGGVERVIRYDDVPLTEGQEYIGAAPQETMLDAETYNLIAQNGEEIEYDYDSLPPLEDNIADVIVAEELFEGFSTELIDKVANAMFKFEPVVDITSYNISTDDTVALFSAIAKYYPTEYSLLTKSDFKYKIIYSPSLGCITDIRFYYGDNANLETFEQRTNDLKTEIGKIVAQVEDMSDFEKALYIHDYIVLNSEYDLELLEMLKSGGTLSGELYSEKYSEYSILVNGTGICGSYALAYRALMTAAGVDCLYLSSQQMNHAWNMVKIDGEWYHVDCCWDDPVPDTFGVTRRTHFLRTDKEIMELNHFSWFPGFYQATSTKYSNMPREYDVYQKYDSGYWYILEDDRVIRMDQFGDGEEELVNNISAWSIDAENGELYYSSGGNVYHYNINDESKEIVLMIPEAKKSGAYASVRNFYFSDNYISYYGFGNNEKDERVYFKGLLESQKALYDAVSKIELSESSLNLQIFDKTSLVPTISSTDSTEDLFVEWSSSDTAVATVDETGEVLAKKGGTTEITAKVGSLYAKCTVNVEVNEYKGFCDNNTKWEFDPETQTMYIYPYESNVIVGSIYMNSMEREVVKHVVLADGIEAIDLTFRKWTALETVKLNNDLKEIGQESFSDCSALKSITIPDSVVYIGKKAFYKCINLSEVTIGKGADTIGISAFGGCTNLETVYFNATNSSDIRGYLGLVTYSPDLASPFVGCTKLSDFIIGASVEAISCKLFITNKSLFSYDCSLTTINIPAATKEISDTSALSYCREINSINVDSDNLFYESIDGVLFDKNSRKLIKYPNTKESTCYTTPAGYSHIAEKAFFYCDNLKELVLSDDVVTVDNSAISYCRSLEKVYIGANIIDMSDTEYKECSALSEINVDENNSIYSSKDGVLFNKNMTVLIEYPEGNKRETYSIPDGVFTLLDNSFYSNSYLEVLEIPYSVTEIKNTKFEYFDKLSEINVDENNSIYSSKDGVLFNKNMTVLIEYPQGNSRKTYSVPYGVKTISGNAFYYTEKIEKVVLPSTLSEIGANVFAGCSSLKFVSIPENITVINIDTFEYCKSFENIMIPKNVTKLDSNSFNYCSQLDKLLILNPSCEFGCFEEGEAPDIGINSNCVIYGYTGSTAQTYAVENNLTFVDIESVPHEHAYFLVDYIPKEDETDGMKHYKCYCGESEYKEYEHHFGENYTIIGNCVDGAIKEFTCSVCGHKENETIESIEHIFELDSTVYGTCIEPGKEIYKCSICSFVEEKELVSDDCHSYTETVTAPTCTEVGYTTATCEYCGENAMYDFVPMLGHDVTVTHTDADCKKCAQTEYSCSRCDYHEIIVDEESGLGDHKISVTATDATCTENGSIDRICVTCNELISSEEIISTGHVPGEWKTVAEATTESAGKKEQRCSVCTELLAEEVIPKIPVNVSDIELKENIIEILNKSTYQLEAIISPNNADVKSVTWSSDNESVVTVDGNGVVTAIALGTANITATTTDGGFTATCTVTVVPREFNITWIVEGERTVESYQEGSVISKPESPEKEGYGFVGWTPKVPDIMPDYDLEFTAIWSADCFGAVFNANGGKWTDGAETKTVSTEFNSQITAPESPVREGYVFSGWTPEVGIMDDVNGKVFNAVWIASTDTMYTVETYTMNTEGEYVKSVKKYPSATDSTVNAEYKIPDGFALNKGKSVLTGIVKADNSLVLKVYIDRNMHTLKLVVDGVSSESKYYYDAIIAEPVTPVKTGCTFKGWSEKLPSRMPAKEVTAEAEWQINSYTVTWIVNGAESKFTVEYGAKIVIPETPNKAGYEFVGWDKQIPETMPANNLIFTAKFNCTASVSIKNNPGAKTIKYGENLLLTAITTNMPNGVKIYWYVDGTKQGEGETFNVSFESGAKKVEVKLVDANGNILKNADGYELSDSESVTVNSGFFQKIISFFKNLFGMDRTVVQ